MNFNFQQQIIMEILYKDSSGENRNQTQANVSSKIRKSLLQMNPNVPYCIGEKTKPKNWRGSTQQPLDTQHRKPNQ